MIKDRKHAVLQASQDEIREEWRTETLGRLTAVEKHAEECNQDRNTLKEVTATLKVEVATLTERNSRIGRCPLKSCPNRLP